MKSKLFSLSFVFIILSAGLMHAQNSPAEIRYIAIGDSYTVGTGSSPQEAWPTLLTKHLQKEGISIRLVANLAQNGWTTQNAVEIELPIYKKLKPTFATVLIGVNDWVRGMPASTFSARFGNLLDEMLKELPNKDRLLIMTIPDFSVTPMGASFGNVRDISSGITQFNDIIKKEAKARGLNVVDIFTLSQQMGQDPSLVADDGLHPSAKEHALWENLIYPQAKRILLGDHR